MRARTTREDADVRIDTADGARKWVAHRVDEEPVLVDDVSTEEEGGTLEGLGEEVGHEERDLLEDREARAELEHEHHDHLLEGEADDDRRPLCT